MMTTSKQDRSVQSLRGDSLSFCCGQLSGTFQTVDEIVAT